MAFYRIRLKVASSEYMLYNTRLCVFVKIVFSALSVQNSYKEVSYMRQGNVLAK